MKENELMIGDWALLRYNHYQTGEEIRIPFRVTQLRINLKNVEAWSEKDGNMGYVEDLEPIPLTHEILKKNGFQDIAGHLYNVGNDYYEIEVYELTDGLWRITCYNTQFKIGDSRMFVRHVHQFQQVLRFCGVDLDIVL